MEIMEIHEIGEPVKKETPQKKPNSPIEEHKKAIALVGFGIIFLAVVLLGILLFDVPVLTCILIAILESILPVFLSRTVVWLHGVVVVLNILLGILFGFTVMMVMACAIYLAGVYAVHILSQKV